MAIDFSTLQNGNVVKFGTLKLDGVEQNLPDVLNPPMSSTGNIEIINTVPSKELEWIYILHNGASYLVANRNLVRGVSWNALNKSQLITGKEVMIDGCKCRVRSLTGGNMTTTANSEWDNFISKDLFGIGNGNEIWHWKNRYSWCQEIYTGSTNTVRGYSSADYSDGYNPNSVGDDVGFRPIIEVLEVPPAISGEDGSIGAYNKSFTKTYTVSGLSNFSLIESVDGQQIRKLEGQTSGEFTLDVASVWGNLSLDEHTITITATDTKGASATRTWTFTKTNQTPTIDGENSDIGSHNKSFTKEYIVTDLDDDLFTIKEVVDATTIRTLTEQKSGNFVLDLSSVWTELSVDKHTITITVTDVNGLTATRVWTFTKTNNPPTISDSDRNIGEFNKTFTKDFTVTEPDDDKFDLEIKVDEEILETLKQQSSGRFVVDVAKVWDKLSLTSHVITITVTDTNKLSAIRKWTFTKTNNTPVISGIDEDLGSKTEPFAKEYTVTDAEGDNFSVEEKVDNIVIRKLESQTDNTFTVNVAEQWAELSEDIHTITITVVDTLGNSSVRTWTFTKGIPKPSVNKVTYFDETLIDLTNDTVNPNTLAEGITAHDKRGKIVTGTIPVNQILTDIETLKKDKVDKKIGFGLSSNDYTTPEKEAVATIGDKVEKEEGKGLSANDFTDIYKKKLDNLANEAGNSKIKYLGETIVPSSSWQDDVTFEDFPYKATISLEGVTEQAWWCSVMTPDSSKPEITSALAPYVMVNDGSFSIYSDTKFNSSVIIKNAVFETDISTEAIHTVTVTAPNGGGTATADKTKYSNFETAKINLSPAEGMLADYIILDGGQDHILVESNVYNLPMNGKSHTVEVYFKVKPPENGDLVKLGTLSVVGIEQSLPAESNQAIKVNTTNIVFNDTVKGKELQWRYMEDAGKQYLVCDRNIIRGISWNTLDNAGFVNGKEITIDGKQYKCRLMTGGESDSDHTCEWNKFIADDTAKIGIGNDVWHWQNVCSWCSNAYGSNRVVRGDRSASHWGCDNHSRPGYNCGFRPILEIL